MEKAKPSKKKAYYKNRKFGSDQESAASDVSNLRLGGVNKSPRFDPNDSGADRTNFAKRSLQQPESRLADLDEIWQETNVGQDFESLLNAPLTADSHFVFKSEKNWTLETSNYDDYFTLNVKELAAIVECIPFNSYVRVDNKYFTKDELTDINNTADKGKEAYNRMMDASKERRRNVAEYVDEESSRGREMVTGTSSDSEDSSDNGEAEQKACQESADVEEDLEFLLSLKEPVRPQPVTGAPVTRSGFEDSKTKTVPAATKSIDLEKWLDLVLDD